MTLEYQWRGAFSSVEAEVLHAEGFGHAVTDYDWAGQFSRHSLGWACARRDGKLIGLVNVAWDGGSHAFILDLIVTLEERRHGVGAHLVETAKRESAAAGCEWLHVDFEAYLSHFYFESCDFTPSSAGIIRLR
jgi:GNAT superfamily N-acetyltransferase